MAGRIRAFRTYGTNANLRETLREFAGGKPGLVTSLVPAAQSRIQGIAADFEDLRAISFDKLVAQILTQAGGAMLPVADPVQIREALAEACQSLPSESPFYASREFPGFVRRLAATLHELRLWRIGPTELDRLAHQLDEWLALKLMSLAHLERNLRERLAGAAREFDTDRLERCLGLKLGDYKPRLWVYSGGAYAPLTADFLKWAHLQGSEVAVVADAHPKVEQSFRGARRLLDHLEAAATFRGRANGLTEGLFSDQPTLDPGVRVQIMSTGDALAECEWALRHLHRELRGRFEGSQVAIYARNLDDYGPLLEASASRLGVALRHARKERLANNGLIRFLLRYWRACSSETPMDLAELALSSYMPLDSENLTRQRSAIRHAATEPDPWTGLKSRLDASLPADAWLWEALRLHAKDEMGSVSHREWADEFADLLKAPWLEPAQNAASPTYERDRAAVASILHAVVNRASLAPAAHEPVPLSEFVAPLLRIVDHNESAPPAAENGVSVVPNSHSLGAAEIVCVLGMIEGAFPRRRSEDPILSDLERAAMDASRPGQPRLSHSHDEAATERDELIRLCAAAGKQIVFVYPQTDEDRDNTPAYYLTEIRRVAADVEVVDIPSARLVPILDDAAFAADRLLAAALDPAAQTWEPPTFQLAESAERMKGMPEEGVATAELRDAIRCPFLYMARRRLRLFPLRSESRWWRLRQLPQAVGLSRIQDPDSAGNALERALNSEIEAQRTELNPTERRLMESGGRRLIRESVQREFLAREIWQKKADSPVPGVSFGQSGTADTLPTFDGSIKVRGRFDVVAEMQGYAVGQVYGSRRITADRDPDKFSDEDLIEIGVPLYSLAKKCPDAALEVDTMGGERILFLLPRRPEANLESRVSQRLRVVDLGDKRAFYDRLREVLSEADQIIRTGVLSPRPGEHCRSCDYGELCRSAQEWGEQFDPFSGDGGSDGE